MKRTTFTSTIAIAIMAGGMAIAATTVEELQAKLAGMGYTDIEVEAEGTVFEVEAMKDGEEWELLFDAETGAELAAFIDMDDDEDEDEDDEDGDEDEDGDDEDDAEDAN